MREHTTNEIFQELDRPYKTVLDFVHEVQDTLTEDLEFDLSGVCAADEVYVVASEKGLKDEDGSRARATLKKDAESSSQTTPSRDARPSLRRTSPIPCS